MQEALLQLLLSKGLEDEEVRSGEGERRSHWPCCCVPKPGHVCGAFGSAWRRQGGRGWAASVGAADGLALPADVAANCRCPVPLKDPRAMNKLLPAELQQAEPLHKEVVEERQDSGRTVGTAGEL